MVYFRVLWKNTPTRWNQYNLCYHAKKHACKEINQACKEMVLEGSKLDTNSNKDTRLANSKIPLNVFLQWLTNERWKNSSKHAIWHLCRTIEKMKNISLKCNKDRKSSWNSGLSHHQSSLSFLQGNITCKVVLRTVWKNSPKNGHILNMRA